MDEEWKGSEGLKQRQEVMVVLSWKYLWEQVG